MIEDVLQQILEEQKKTNSLLEVILSGDLKSSPNYLLTMQQVSEEYDIGINMVQKMFRDPELPVQRYTIPFKVARSALLRYFEKRHDNLKGGI